MRFNFLKFKPILKQKNKKRKYGLNYIWSREVQHTFGKVISKEILIWEPCAFNPMNHDLGLLEKKKLWFGR